MSFRDFDLFGLAAVLGIVEGLTEFIPVSSTGHLIILGDLLGFDTPAAGVFEIVIQLGAILAVCWAYRQKLTAVLVGLRSDPAARHFAAIILAAFAPAAVVGALGHDFIKSVLFSPWVVCVSLIVGGLAILAIERMRPEPRVRDMDRISVGTAVKIGLCQCLAMIPGVSRAGATIMGALLLGVERKAAAEFSFLVAIPTMLGATALDLFKNRAALDLNGGELIAVGFATAFIMALVVVRSVVGFIGRHGFAPFAWYRIAVGALMIGLLLLR